MSDSPLITEVIAFRDNDLNTDDSRQMEVALYITALVEENRKLRNFIQTLLDEDPNAFAADGGVTVLCVWRKDVGIQLGLHKSPTGGK